MKMYSDLPKSELERLLSKCRREWFVAMGSTVEKDRIRWWLVTLFDMDDEG
jgi:hypothetical protein